VTVVITLQCDGVDTPCSRTYVQAGGVTSEARAMARAAGWRTDPRLNTDRCPPCTALAAASAPPVPCRTCDSEGRRMPYSDALGHNRLGHATAHALMQHGVLDWPQLLRMDSDALCRVQRLGEAGRALIATACWKYATAPNNGARRAHRA
jgi:hypothetical protein